MGTIDRRQRRTYAPDRFCIPLYFFLEREIWKDENTCPVDAHAGLWYYKFCNKWCKDKNGNLTFEKTMWMETVTKRRVGNGELLAEYHQRLQQLIRSRKGIMLRMRNTGRFITGLGQPHPVENGMSWHMTLGVPFLPGSSVKGMVRTWAEWENGKQNREEVQRIFGPESEAQEKHIGTVIFFDALPREPVKLDTEMITPHYGPYYQRLAEYPGDWFDPVPIPYLTVAPNQVFIFAIAPRDAQKEEHLQDLKRVKKWLQQALKWCGAGAKTSTGYGRFEIERERRFDEP